MKRESIERSQVTVEVTERRMKKKEKPAWRR